MTTSTTTPADASPETPLVRADHSNTNRVYHTDPDCYGLQRIRSPRVATATEVETLGLSECVICANDGDTGGGDLREVTCPECGEPTEMLPVHIRACDGGDDNE